jgi:hypothetical protein
MLFFLKIICHFIIHGIPEIIISTCKAIRIAWFSARMFARVGELRKERERNEHKG